MEYKEKIDTQTVYKEYVDALMKVLNDFDNISFILSNEKALELVDRLETLGYKFNEYDTFSFGEFEKLYNTEILLVSKSYWEDKEHYSLESAYGYHDLKTIEGQDVVFVEEGLVDSDELKEHIDCPIVTLTKSEFSEDDEDELDELFEELTQEVLEDIIENQDEEDFCLHCAIKDAIIEAYEIGLHDGLYGEEE